MAKTKSKPKPAAKVSNKPKGRNDAYTLMLFVSFVAMALGCFMLYKDFEEYGQQSAPKTKPPELQKLGDDGLTRGVGPGAGGGGAGPSGAGGAGP